jgi:putative transposase
MKGRRINRKRLERIWHEKGLLLPQRHKKHKRLPHHDSSVIRLRPLYANPIWSIDFAHDRLGLRRMKVELLPHAKRDPAVKLMREINTSCDSNNILKPRALFCTDMQA